MFRHLRDGEGIAKCSRDDVIQFFDGISEHNGTSDIRSDYKDVMSVAKYIKDRWIQSHRTLHVFMAKQEAWLEKNRLPLTSALRPAGINVRGPAFVAVLREETPHEANSHG